ncbi:TolC family protein [Deinococcus aerophilus]|uniref:Transporter n=1 Tax=Deinococcus aerophilus TaxID=522488 RepID=A0ABQ2GK39_9DEIO|nr:TolC family protein [Deinococcus aerophilus]GGL99042.1 transporter [Deinococcus aerophilus]
MPDRSCSLFLTALLALGLLGAPVAAQVTPPGPSTVAPAPLSAPALAPAESLQDVLTALRGSPGWRGADLTYRAAQLALDSARTRAGLSLTVGADSSLVKVPWSGGEWQGSTTVTVGASLAVLPWSAAREAVRAAERALAAAAVALRSDRASLTVQAVQAYAGARSAAATLALADAQLALNTRLLAIATDQHTQNLITAEALLERQAALQSAQASRDGAARGVALAAAQLTRVLGQPITLPGDPAAFGALPLLAPAGDLSALLARALAARPEIARAEVALADAGAGLSAAELDARVPDLTASVRAGQLGGGQGGAGRVVSGNLNSKSGVLGAQLSVPLKDTSALPNGVALSLSGTFTLLGSPARDALTQARLGVQQAQLGLDTARQAIELEVRTRLSDFQDAQEGLTSLQTSLVRAQTAVNSARARLEAGLGTTWEVMQAELGVVQARNAVDTQLAAVALAALQLAQATADLDPALLGAVPRLPDLAPPTGERP